MKLFKKLNSRGHSHILIPLLVVILIGGIGTFVAVHSLGHATPAPTRCYGYNGHTYGGWREYNCSFYTIAPVVNIYNQRVGTIHSGTNWVLCQQQGSTVRNGNYYNNWWAYTLSDQNKVGWVSALYGSGGANYGAFGGVPNCGGHKGAVPIQRVPGPPPAPNPSPAPQPGASGYVNPLRGARLTNERIDQGVDFGGTGNVYALGNGTVVHTFDSGWPGGVFIVYQLTSGAASGRYVYVAEGCGVKVNIGQHVNSSTILCVANGGGIETGWAQAPGNGWYAYSHVEYSQRGDGYATEAGQNFSALLRSLGAPYGNIAQSSGRASSASLSGFPNW